MTQSMTKTINGGFKRSTSAGLQCLQDEDKRVKKGRTIPESVFEPEYTCIRVQAFNAELTNPDQLAKTNLETNEDIKPVDTDELNEILKAFRRDHKSSIYKAFFVYKADDPNDIFIIAYLNYPPLHIKQWKTYKDYKVLFMDYLYADSEAVRVNSERKEFPENTEIKLRNAITKHADDLMSKHCNLEIISASPVRSKDRGKEIKNELCIVVYCRNKGLIPFGEQPFPKNIDEFGVDVREGFFQWSPSTSDAYKSGNEFQSTLRMGCSIGAEGKQMKGTLGGFVDTEAGLGFLTCAHVLYNSSELQSPLGNQIVVQPADGELQPNDTSDRNCGSVLRAKFATDESVGVDCAVVKITQRIPKFGDFCNLYDESLKRAGFAANNPPRYISGKINADPRQGNNRDRRLIKCGRTTGLRRGVFEFDGAALKVDQINLSLDEANKQTFCMKGQFEVQGIGGRSFVEDGDSGSLVFMVEDDNSLTCIGMVEGWTSYYSSVVTPITAILKQLNLDQTKLYSFPEDAMEID